MILAGGEALFDIFLGDTKGPSIQMDARVGGSPFNVAVGLARLGRPAGFLATISTDLLGQFLCDRLAAEGVSQAYLVRKPALTTLAVVGVDEHGSPRYAFYGEAAADRQLMPADLPVDLDDIRALHLGSFSSVVEPVGSTLEELAARLKHRAVVAFDPNVRPIVVPDMAVWRRKVDALARHVHILKMSAEDFAVLYPGEAPETRARAWLGQGVRLVLVTDGARGAGAWFGDSSASVPGIPVAVVDTVGAGDTFQAAVLCALDEAGVLTPEGMARLEQPLIRSVMEFAVRAAAITCSRRGADLPRRDEL